MKRLVSASLILLAIFLSHSSAIGNDVYYAQVAAGGNTGADCADALAYNDATRGFNTASNWTSGAPSGTIIGPSTTAHACGTWTGAANATMLVFQGSGTSGSPITLRLETGAIFTAPYWQNSASYVGGAINGNSQSYIVIDGGTNGTIQNTALGTTLTYQTAATEAILLGNCQHCEVKNMTISNMFQRSGSGIEATNWNCDSAIVWYGSANYVTIDNNTINMGGWALTGNGDNITIGPGNNIGNYDHTIATAAAHFTIYGNHFHDWAVWDSASDAYHHDGLHCFAGTAGNTQAAYIYNNLFDGSTGNNMNQFIFLEGNTSTTRCMVPGGTDYIFNNIGNANTSFPALWGPYGNATTGDSHDVLVNNTAISNQPSAGATGIVFANSASMTIENNAMSGTGILVSQPSASLTSNFVAFDYNAYEYCTGYNCFDACGVDSGSFTVWQQTNNCGADAHGIANLASSTYFNLSASYQPNAGSPLIGAGANLTGLCTGNLVPLCSDYLGVLRPASGAWDIGAVQHAIGPPVAPGNVKATPF